MMLVCSQREVTQKLHIENAPFTISNIRLFKKRERVRERERKRERKRKKD